MQLSPVKVIGVKFPDNVHYSLANYNKQAQRANLSLLPVSEGVVIELGCQQAVQMTEEKVAYNKGEFYEN